MLDAYLQEKFDLYARFSAFACDDSCPRYGCRGDLVVSASLLDMYVQSRFLARPIGDLFDFAYKLGCSPDNGLSMTRVRFVLQKPCVFLRDRKLCSVYSTRPAPCALFPEYCAVAEEKERQAYGDMDYFPCLKPGAFTVSGERGGALRKLWKLHEREILASEIYLFGFAGFVVDLRAALISVSDETNNPVPYARVEAALVRVLKQKGIYQRIMEKMSGLEKDQGINNYLSALSIAEALMERGV